MRLNVGFEFVVELNSQVIEFNRYGSCRSVTLVGKRSRVFSRRLEPSYKGEYSVVFDVLSRTQAAVSGTNVCSSKRREWMLMLF